MSDNHAFGRFGRPLAAFRGIGRRTNGRDYASRLLLGVAALACSSATLSCALAALAAWPVAGVLAA